MIAADPSHHGKPEHFFAGQVHAVRISNVALYDRDFTPQIPFRRQKSTKLLLTLDEGKGNIAHASSRNGYDGEVIGARWVRDD